MRIRKYLVILLSILLILSTACSKASFEGQENLDSMDVKAVAEAEGSNEKKAFRIGMAQCNFAEPWRVVMNQELNKAAAKYPEIELTIADGMQDNNKQISDIQGFMEKGYDLIIISPNEAKPLTAIVKKVYEAGIPVILMDRKVEGDYYTQFIGADNVQIGRMAGEWAARYLGEEGGNIIEIRGSDGTSAQKERRQGFVEGIAQNPKAQIIDSRNADWLRENGIRVMESMLEVHPKIDVVYGHNDPCAEGAYMAAHNVNRENEMAFIGIDALPTPDGGIQSVVDGRLNVTYVYPSGGKEVIENCYNLLVKGEPLKKNVTLETVEVTPENAVKVLQEFIDE